MFDESMLMIQQPFLFEDFEILEEAVKPDVAGRRVVSKINKLRRALSIGEREFDFYLAVAVREIKSVSSLDADKQLNLVLTCIETCCHTWAEIQEDSHLPMERVREIIRELNERDLIFGKKRLTVGGSANQTLIFSRRNPCRCV
jgi:hypothetical protein